MPVGGRRKSGTPCSSNHGHTLRAVSGNRNRGRPIVLSVLVDRLENATKPSPFTDNAGSSIAAIAGRMSRVELVICGDEVRFAICMRNTAADDHPSMGTGTVGASSIVAPEGALANEDLESRVESVLPPGRWLDSAGRHGRQNCCRFIPPSTQAHFAPERGVEPRSSCSACTADRGTLRARARGRAPPSPLPARTPRPRRARPAR